MFDCIARALAAIAAWQHCEQNRAVDLNRATRFLCFCIFTWTERRDHEHEMVDFEISLFIETQSRRRVQYLYIFAENELYTFDWHMAAVAAAMHSWRTSIEQMAFVPVLKMSHVQMRNWYFFWKKKKWQNCAHDLSGDSNEKGRNATRHTKKKTEKHTLQAINCCHLSMALDGARVRTAGIPCLVCCIGIGECQLPYMLDPAHIHTDTLNGRDMRSAWHLFDDSDRRRWRRKLCIVGFARKNRLLESSCNIDVPIYLSLRDIQHSAVCLCHLRRCDREIVMRQNRRWRWIGSGSVVAVGSS